MPATRKSFSRAHHTGKKTAPGLALSSFTSKTNPTSSHNAKRRGGGPPKKNEATKERDREIMEGINRDVGYKGQAFMGGIMKPLPEAKKDPKSTTTNTPFSGGASMNPARLQRLGGEKVDLVGSLGGLSTK